MAAASTVPQAAPLSEGARIVNTFFSPTKTFTDINRKASWFAAWLIISVFVVGFIAAAGQRVGWDQITRNQTEKQMQSVKFLRDQWDKLSVAQREEAIQKAIPRTKWLSYILPPVIQLVIFIVL